MSAHTMFQTEPFTELTIFEAEALPTAVVETKNHPMAELETLFDQTFSGLFPALAEADVAPVGPAFALYTRQPTDTVDMQVGIPVSKGLAQALDLGNDLLAIPAELPGGSVAARSYFGAYDGLGAAWNSLSNEVLEAGYQPGLPFFEVYVSEPTPDSDPATLRTDLFIHLG